MEVLESESCFKLVETLELKTAAIKEERTRAQRWARCPPVPDHYAALGIKNTANSVQVKKAYRHLA